MSTSSNATMRALFWKEWRQTSHYFFIGMSLFVALPAIASIEEAIHLHTWQRLLSIETADWVQAAAGIWALFVATGMVCPDLAGRVPDFWRSRPLSIHRWMGVKFLVGLLVAVLPCVVSLLLDISTTRFRRGIDLLTLGPAMWAALYAFAFFCACLLHRPAPALMTAAGAMLVVYLLPAVVPGLRWLSYSDVSPNYEFWSISEFHFNRGEMAFDAGYAAIAIAALAASLFVIARDLRVESTQQIMYGSVAAVLVMSSSTLAYHLGNNLEIRATAKLEPNQIFRWEASQRDFAKPSLLTIASTWTVDDNSVSSWKFYRRSIDIQPDKIAIGPSIPISQFEDRYDAMHVDGRMFWLDGRETSTDTTVELDLHEFDSHTETDVSLTPLWQRGRSNIHHYAKGQRLYIFDRDHCTTIDVSVPSKPQIVSETQGFEDSSHFDPDVAETTFPLPRIPDLGPEDRLKAVLERYRDYYEDGLLCVDESRPHSSLLVEYKVTAITDKSVTFKAIGRYQASMLQSLGDNPSFRELTVHNGLLYVTVSESGGFNPGIEVFEMRGDRPLHRIAHFAAPDVGWAVPLEDGRILTVGQQTLYLVDAPRRDPALAHVAPR